MNEITIRRLTHENELDLNLCDSSFTVESVLSLRVESLPDLVSGERGRINYRVSPVTPYVKRYAPEEYDVRAYIERADHAAWLAYVEGRIAGQVLVREHWNRFAIIWDIAVDPPFRRRGIGSKLIDEAIGWAREKGLPGVIMETQNINAGACRLYEQCGFELGGFDRYLYQGVMPGTHEIALYWYLLFDTA